jgi:hypothetical protein
VSTPSREALLARYRTIGAAAEERTRQVTPAPQITSTHREVVELLDELLGMVTSSADGTYAALIRNFRRLEPLLLRDFAKSDPQQVAAFAHFIGNRLLAIGGGAQDARPQPGSDQSQSA